MKNTGTHNIGLLTHNPTRQSFLIARFRRALLALALLSFISLYTHASAQEENHTAINSNGQIGALQIHGRIAVTSAAASATAAGAASAAVKRAKRAMVSFMMN
jgi:hypothetical protein